MPSFTTAPVVNRLIESLSPKARQQILHSCEQVELSSGTVLCKPDQPFRYVYFPLTSFITLVTTLSDHQLLDTRGCLSDFLSTRLLLHLKNLPP